MLFRVTAKNVGDVFSDTLYHTAYVSQNRDNIQAKSKTRTLHEVS